MKRLWRLKSLKRLLAKRCTDEIKSGTNGNIRTMFNHTQLKTALLLAHFFVITHNAIAQDWPRWRGPNGDGAVVGFIGPKIWPDQLKQRWKINVGAGHSSPLVISSSVYLHSRQGENEVVASYDLSTGKIIWQDRYPVVRQLRTWWTPVGNFARAQKPHRLWSQVPMQI
jgi:hypothetical protein